MNAVAHGANFALTVRAHDLVAYLRATGWYEADPSGPFGPVWRLRRQPDEPYEILFPQDPAFLDYSLRLEEAIHNLAVVERRSEQEILADIATVEADVIRIRLRASATGDSLPLEAGVRIFSEISSLVRAAAWAALDPRPIFKGRAPAAVLRYLRENISFGQTERGSYVVTLHSAVPPRRAADARTLHPTRRQESFSRRATRTLASALAAVSTIMLDGSDRNVVPQGDLITKGVSANFCQALARMIAAGAGDDLRFDFSCSSAEPAPDLARSIALPRTSAPTLLRIADRLPGSDLEYQATSMNATVLRESPSALTLAEGAETEVHGLVTGLDHIDSTAGTVRITVYIDNHPRSVIVQLSGVVYEMARQAYESRMPIHCAGVLRREGRIFTLRDPLGFGLEPVE